MVTSIIINETLVYQNLILLGSFTFFLDIVRNLKYFNSIYQFPHCVPFLCWVLIFHMFKALPDIFCFIQSLFIHFFTHRFTFYLVLYFFLHSHTSFWVYFHSAWKILFSICFSVGLLMSKFFFSDFDCLKTHIFLSFLNDIFSGYESLD